MHFLIVGGGSAGCVLAARLSEHADDYKVTLVEAGRDITANMRGILEAAMWVGPTLIRATFGPI